MWIRHFETQVPCHARPPDFSLPGMICFSLLLRWADFTSGSRVICFGPFLASVPRPESCPTPSTFLSRTAHSGKSSRGPAAAASRASGSNVLVRRDARARGERRGEFGGAAKSPAGSWRTAQRSCAPVIRHVRVDQARVSAWDHPGLQTHRAKRAASTSVSSSNNR